MSTDTQEVQDISGRQLGIKDGIGRSSEKRRERRDQRGKQRKVSIVRSSQKEHAK